MGERHGPSGLRNTFLLTNEDHCLTLSDGYGGEILYDTGEVKEGYAKDSIGALNGMQNVTKPLPASFDEFVELFEAEPLS